MSEKSKNDTAWEILFEKYHILDHINDKGIYEISAKTINTKREARLMTKFDHHIQLPTIFKQNHLTIQPDSRGTYVIGKFESYLNLPSNHSQSKSIHEIDFPVNIETLNPTNIYSEAASILCAYNSGIIEDLLKQKVFFTVFGRMSTGKFSYLINNFQQNSNYQIDVNNSQCEIDAGFEGDDVFAIIEAKNENVDDFLIRQLYYPYRLWISKINKQVIPILLSYSNDIFSFYVYKFKDDNNYNSIELVEQKRYQIGSNDIELDDVMDILAQVIVTLEPVDIPFPQADVFPRVVDLLMYIYGVNPLLSKEDITTNYAFNIRQAGYYADAAIYLGLLQKQSNRGEGIFYSMTEKGSQIMEKTSRRRNLGLIKCILEKKIFNKTLHIYLDQGKRPERHLVNKILGDLRLELSNETIERRSQTVFAWIDWIMGLTQPLQEE